MKNLRFYLGFVALAAGLAFSGCDKDDDAKPVVFPEKKEVVVSAGESTVISFDATSQWTLTSSAIWCKIEDGSEKVSSLQGKAGRAEVKIHISDEARDSNTAELTLKMNNESKVIYVITRPAKALVFKVFNADKTQELGEGNPFVQLYDGSGKFVVVTEIDWKVETTANIDFSQTVAGGKPNVEVVVSPALGANVELRKNGWDSQLVFKNIGGETVKVVPVRYDGMPESVIEFSHRGNELEVVEFTYEGDKYKDGSANVDGPFKFNVAARDDKYTHVYIEYFEEMNDAGEYEFENYVLAEDECWFTVTDDKKGGFVLSTQENMGKLRNGFLMVFPTSVYDKVKNNFEKSVFSTTEGINKNYEQYIAVIVKQAANPAMASGFTVTDQEGTPLFDENGEELELTSYRDGSDKSDEEIIELFGTTNVHILSLPLGTAYDYIVAAPKGFTGYYVTADIVQGWAGVELVESDDIKTVTITGIGEQTKGEKSLQINVFDPENADAPFAVLLIERY